VTRPKRADRYVVGYRDKDNVAYGKPTRLQAGGGLLSQWAVPLTLPQAIRYHSKEMVDDGARIFELVDVTSRVLPKKKKKKSK